MDDLSSVLAGLFFGIPIGMGIAYLATHAEFRESLFSRFKKKPDNGEPPKTS